MKKQIKKFNEQKFNSEVAEYNKLISLVLEQEQICLEIANVKTIAEVEEFLNKSTGFIKTSLSAEVLGKEIEYKSLMELEKQINGKLSKNDLTTDNKLKTSFINQLKEQHIVYFTDDEIKTRNTLKEIVNKYNSLPVEVRFQNHIAFKRDSTLSFTPFSFLR